MPVVATSGRIASSLHSLLSFRRETNLLQFRGALAAALALSLTSMFAGCTGGSAIAPHMQTISTQPCPLSAGSLRSASLSTMCGTGSYGQQNEKEILLDGDVSTSQWDGYLSHPVNGNGADSSNHPLGTVQAAWTVDAAREGGAAYAVGAPSITASQITIQQIDWTYLQPGINQLVNGVTLNVNATNNTAAADFNRNGLSYHINFSMEADNDTVDATFTQSNGIVSYGKYKASELVPTAASTVGTFSAGRTTAGLRHTLASTAAKVAAVAGLVAAASAAVAFFFPPAAPIAGGVAVVAGVVAAAAVCIDVFQPAAKVHKT